MELTIKIKQANSYPKSSRLTYKFLYTQKSLKFLHVYNYVLLQEKLFLIQVIINYNASFLIGTSFNSYLKCQANILNH